MTFEQICRLVKHCLENYPPLDALGIRDYEAWKVKRIVEECKETTKAPMTEDAVRETVFRVLNQLAELSNGFWMTIPPDGPSDDSSHVSLSRGNITLLLAKRFDPSAYESVLTVACFPIPGAEPDTAS